MIKLPLETPTATLRYALTPDEAGVAAIEATFAAYHYSCFLDLKWAR